MSPKAFEPVLVCGRVFEPSRVQQQCLSQAYEHIVRERRCGGVSAAKAPPGRHAAETVSSVSPIPCGGYCA